MESWCCRQIRSQVGGWEHVFKEQFPTLNAQKTYEGKNIYILTKYFSEPPVTETVTLGLGQGHETSGYDDI